MSEIREGEFGMLLPGEWGELESDEPGTRVWGGVLFGETVSVTLLEVAPVYAMSEPRMLLGQYLHHRPMYESGKDPALLQSEPVTHDVGGGALEGAWIAEDASSGRRLAHRVILSGTTLADVRYEATGMEADAFSDRAAIILGTAEVGELEE